MVKSENSQNLFNPSGCLTMEAINRYHNDHLHERELQLVKAHLQDCEICSDAVEGYKILPDQDRQSQILFSLRKKIKSKYSSGTGTGSKGKRLNPTLAYISAAATILIILGIYGIMNTDIFQQDNRVAEKIQEKEETRDLVSRIEEPKDESMNTPVPETTESVEMPEQQKDQSMNPLPEEEIEMDAVDDMPEERALELDIEEKQPVEAYAMKELIDTNVLDGVVAVGGIEDEKAARESVSEEVAGVAAKSEPMDWEKAAKKTKADQIDKTLEIQPLALVDEIPEFSKTGYGDFEDFIEKNLKYSPDTINRVITGQVIVQFIVTKEGLVENVKIKVGIDPLLDKEAIRVIRSSPRWKPGRIDGQKVNVQLEYTVTFK